MTASLQEQFDTVFAQLQEDGLLLMSDVTYAITKEKIRGSWWSHKFAQRIFDVSEMLEDHRDVLIMKLISGKVTFVHRELWNHIYSIGTAREEWQLKNLSASARQLLERVDNEGSVRNGKTAAELELQLLIHAQQIHTESGKHAKVLETWQNWASRAGFLPRRIDPVAARRFLERRLTDINKRRAGGGRLPWPSTL